MDDRLAKVRDVSAERAVLGSMMMREQVAVEVYDLLTSGDFYEATHGFIFDAIVKLMLDAEPVDPIAVADRLTREGLLDKVGGGPYLAELMDAAIPSSVMYHAKIVKEMSRRRQLAACMIKGYQRALDLNADLDTVISAAQADIQAATMTASTARRGPVFIGDEIDQTIAARVDPDEHREERGISTGIGALDQLICGLKPGQLVFIGGRPGDGKSLLLTGIARHAAIRQGARTLMVSLEMRRDEIYDRILAAEAQVNLHRLVSRSSLHLDEIHRLTNVGANLRRAPLAIEDGSAIDINQIRAIARMHQLRHGLDLLLVDYVQLVSATSEKETRSQQLDAIAAGLKRLAGELNIPIVAAAQLGRQVETRSDRRPQLSDLRESGGLENAANIAILIMRPDKADPETPRAGEIDLIVAKNRNGPLDTVTGAAQLHYARIVDIEYQNQ